MKRNMTREIAPGMFIPAGFSALSATMFKFACEMARVAESGEFRPRVAYPMAAVIHAAASLEAFLNEELEKIVTTWGSEWESTLESLEKLDIQKKWVVFPKLLHNRTFDAGAEPYQSFCGLINLRNALMHYRPVATADAYIPKKLEHLRSKFAFDSHENQHWPSKILTPSCARWACITARNTVRGYFQVIGQDEIWPTFEEMSWSLPFDG